MIGTYTVQKVWVLAISVTIGTYHLLKILLLIVIRFPGLIVVARLSFLKLIQQDFVFIDNLGQASNSVCSIQGIVGVKAWLSLTAARTTFDSLSRLWSHTWMSSTVVPFKDSRRVATSTRVRFQIDLQHFSQQYSVLILDFTHSLHFF